MVLFFAHIPLVVNRTFNAVLTECRHGVAATDGKSCSGGESFKYEPLWPILPLLH